MESESLLPSTQETATGICPEPDESSLYLPPSYFSYINFNIVLPSSYSSP
jgi:hypothetical protein